MGEGGRELWAFRTDGDERNRTAPMRDATPSLRCQPVLAIAEGESDDQGALFDPTPPPATPALPAMYDPFAD